MPLPQDLFRNYSRPFASNAILRLRCSSGFTVARGYGHMRADEQFDNLYHVPSCHSDSCFAVDLEFDSPSGVTSNLDVQAKKKNVTRALCSVLMLGWLALCWCLYT
jgi:hypothetical protein